MISLKLLGLKIYRASNLLAPVPVVHIKIAVGPDEMAGGKAQARTAAERLIEILPAIPKRSAPDQPAVPVFPEERIYAPEEMVAYVALALQREFGFEVNFAQGRSVPADGTREAICQYGDARLGLASGQLAVVLVDAALSTAGIASSSSTSITLPRLLADGVEALRAQTLGVLTRRIIWEGERRDIPWSRIYSHPNQKTVELGHGHKLRRFRGSYTSDTSYVSTMLATSKHGACELFRSHGIPVPRQILVNDSDAAVAAAHRIGYPVVVKPEFADMGYGVRINLGGEQSVRNAFEVARAYGPVLVGEQIRGEDYRVTLIHGHMVAAGRDIAAHVVGNGHSTVEQLIAILNSDPRRGSQDYCTLTTIVVDDEIRRTLEEQNVTLASILRVGAVIWLRRWWRQSKDHVAEDVTRVVHPANRVMFERAARLIGLDIAGIDFVSPDISQPWMEVGGAILEINPTPGLNTHVRAGSPDVLTMVVDAYFPPGDNGRIPTAAVISSLGALRNIAHILTVSGYKVGLATSEGIEIDNALIAQGNFPGPARAHMVLSDPMTEVAVLQFSAGGAIDEGLGLDKAGVGGVLSLAASSDPSTETQISHNKQENFAALIVKAAHDVVVLNAEEPGCVRLAEQSQAKRLCWIANNPDLPIVANHIGRGGLAITPVDRNGVTAICLWDGKEPSLLMTDTQEDEKLVETMFAVAITRGLGVSVPVITEALAKKR